MPQPRRAPCPGLVGPLPAAATCPGEHRTQSQKEHLEQKVPVCPTRIGWEHAEQAPLCMLAPVNRALPQAHCTVGEGGEERGQMSE